MPIIHRKQSQYVLEVDQGDVKYIVGKCAISEQVLLHPQQSNFTKPTSGWLRSARACFFNAPYLGKEPTLRGECGGEARL